MAKKTSRKKKKRLTLSALLLFCLLVLATYQGAGLLRLLMLKGTIEIGAIKHGLVEEVVPLRGIVIKEETLLRSPIKGNLTLLSTVGQRVAKGNAVAKVQSVSLDTPGGMMEQQIYAPSGGLLCIDIDGLEEVVCPANMGALSLEQLNNLPKKPLPSDKLLEQVDKGQVVAKLMDNLKPIAVYTTLPQDPPVGERLQPAREIKLKYRHHTFYARVIKVSLIDDKYHCLLSAQEYPEALGMERNIDFALVNEELSGFLIPHRALVYRGDKPGLYKITRQRVRWIAVEIKGRLSQEVVIQGENLVAGMDYIINPQLLLEEDYIH